MTIIKALLLSSTSYVGDSVFIGVYADTGGKPIAGIDVILNLSSRLDYIKYTPLKPLVNVYHVPQSHTVTFTQILPPIIPNFAVKDLIAVIECRAVSAGRADITFDFTLGKTTDTNFAADGKDILEKVENRRLTIKT